MVNVFTLQFDYSYQRGLDEKRVNIISQAFCEGAMKAISVSIRSDGSMYVYDGMHTVKAAMKAGIHSLPAVIVIGDQKKEAGWFLKINGSSTKRVKQADVQKAGIVADDDLSKATQNILDKYSLSITKSKLKVGHTNAIGAIKRYYQTFPAALEKAMNAIQALWAEDSIAWSGVVLRGMFDIAKTTDSLDSVITQCRKKQITPRRIADYASALQLAAGANGGGSAHAKNAILKLCGIKK